MKDFLKCELAQGDRVVHGVGGRYAGLSGPYTIHSFTPKMVRLSARGIDEVWTTVPPHNLVKVPQEPDDWKRIRDAEQLQAVDAFNG